MAEKYSLKIITPTEIQFSGEVEEIIVGTVDGPIGVLARHIDSIINLKPGITEVVADGKRNQLFTAEGVLKISGKQVTIITEASESADEIDLERAEEAMKRAEERLRSKKEGINPKRAEAALQRAICRIKIKR